MDTSCEGEINRQEWVERGRGGRMERVSGHSEDVKRRRRRRNMDGDRVKGGGAD